MASSSSSSSSSSRAPPPLPPPPAAAAAAAVATSASAFSSSPSAFSIDALPYIDSGFSDRKQQVAELVAQEARRSTKTPAQYLEDLERLPALPELNLPEDSIAAQCLAALEAGQPLSSVLGRVKGVNSSSVVPSAPQGDDQKDLDKWQEAVDQARSALEYQTVRLVNLELLKRFGAQAWRMHCDSLDGFAAAFSARAKESTSAVTRVNRKRKAEQLLVAPELNALSRQYDRYIEQTSELAVVCDDLEKAVKRMKQEAADRGIDLSALDLPENLDDHDDDDDDDDEDSI